MDANQALSAKQQAHFNIGLNTGLSEAQMRSLIAVLKVKVGKKEAENAGELFGKVLSSREK